MKYRVKNKFQLIQLSLTKPDGTAGSMILKKGITDNVDEWFIKNKKIQSKFIKPGLFTIIPMDEVHKNKEKKKKAEKARIDARKIKFKPIDKSKK